ncbi:MAG: hypothetical protein HY594_03585 [Candidatus Omnitrophica bacterium]|nr:hypothetical protein [Candidatus Omnitrophota bacterium]
MQIIGHRGDPLHAPENTLASLEMAYRHGRRVFEVDVQITADGVPVALHDARLERTTSGRGRVARTPWKKIQKLDAGSWFSPSFSGEPVPSLQQILRAFRNRPVRFFLDLKAHHAERAVHRVIVREKALGRCAWAGYAVHSLRIMADLRPRIPVYRVTGFKQPVTGRVIEQAQALKLDGLLVYKRWVTRRLSGRLAKAKLKLYVWTIRRASEERRMTRFHVAAMMSERCQKSI